MSEQFPRGMRAFIERCLTSAVQVEVLLLIHHERDHAWTAEAVGRALRVEPDQAAAAMQHLAGRGLLVSGTDGYRLSPGRTHDRAMVDRLADFYPNYRVAVISLIFSRPSGPVRDFSEAFRLRDED